MPKLSERDKVAHLLRRFALGASEAELDYYGASGHQGAIEKLLAYDKVTEGFDYEIDNFALEVPNARGKVKNLKPQGTQIWWYTKLLTTQRPLEQKLTVFWHNHFATSGEKVDNGYAMHAHLETLRTHALGRMENLLLAISMDPAMIYWLDNNDNLKGKPNENFAREVMELFTLGVGNYTEKDVQEAARAFTGWRFGVVTPNGRMRVTSNLPRLKPEFLYSPELHDDGVKEILGNKGNFNGEDVCGILVGKPQTSKFIAKKMWEWFAYSDPEPALVDRLANQWYQSGLDIKVLVRSIMEAPEFYSEKAVRKLVKNPVDFAVPPVRQLGIGAIMADRIKADQAVDPGKLDGKAAKANRLLGPAQATRLATKAMGMELVFPPDVSGWKTGAEWISSATMLERIKWADMLMMGGTVVVGANGRRQARANAYPAASLLAGVTDPAEAARVLVSVLDTEFTAAKMKQLTAAAGAAAGGDKVTAQNANAVADAVARLIFGSPEFQFC